MVRRTVVTLSAALILFACTDATGISNTQTEVIQATVNATPVVFDYNPVVGSYYGGELQVFGAALDIFPDSIRGGFDSLWRGFGIAIPHFHGVGSYRICDDQNGVHAHYSRAEGSAVALYESNSCQTQATGVVTVTGYDLLTERRIQGSFTFLAHNINGSDTVTVTQGIFLGQIER